MIMIRMFIYTFMFSILMSNFTYSYESKYYKLLLKKCSTIENRCEFAEKNPKFFFMKKNCEKKLKLCDIAKYCFKHFRLHVCDNTIYVCEVGSIACVSPVCRFGEKYCVGNCECNDIVNELDIIPYAFTFF